jgi:hypothetical protein
MHLPFPGPEKREIDGIGRSVQQRRNPTLNDLQMFQFEVPDQDKVEALGGREITHKFSGVKVLELVHGIPEAAAQSELTNDEVEQCTIYRCSLVPAVPSRTSFAASDQDAKAFQFVTLMLQATDRNPECMGELG